jgi:hypothetical protein
VAAPVRQTSKGIRAVFVIGSVLVFAAGFQLFILTDHTEKWFAWTIKVPMTAAFLGAFYWTALALAVLSARERIWVRARVGVPGVFLFIALTFVLTLMHLSLFHFHADGSIARGAAYLWFVIYAVDPPLVLVAWILQLRKPGFDPPRSTPLPVWFRAAIGIQSVIVLAVGVAMFAAPGTGRVLWPWPLTPLTARAVSAWLLGLGLVIATAFYENDWVRIRPATAAYAALGFFQFIALARYRDAPSWSDPASWAYVAFLVSATLVGVYGWGASNRAASSTRDRVPLVQIGG